MADEFELGVADYLANPTDPVGPRLKNSLLYGVTRSPDTEAKMRAYSRELGVPLPSAENDQEFVAPQAQVQRLDPNGMILGQPKVADWMSEPANAAISHDDIPALSALENLARGIGERGAQVGGTVLQGAMALVDRPADKLADFSESLGVPTVIDFTKDGVKFRNRTAAERGMQGDAASAAIVQGARNADLGYEARQWSLGDPISEFLPFALEQGIVSVPDMAAVMASTPLYVLGRSAEIGQQRATNESRPEATLGDMLKAAPAAVVSAMLEKIGTKGILGLDDVVKGGFKAVPKAVAGAALKEGLTEAGQEGVEELGGTLGTPGQMNVGQLAENMIVAGLAGATFGGAVRSVTGNVQAVANRAQFQAQQAAQATEQAQTVGDMVNAAQASALRQRDPQTFKEYIDHVTAETPAESVYISAADLAASLGQGDPAALTANAEALKAMPLTMARLQDALPGNGLVEIPTSELLAYTPETAMAQSLIENLKTDPNGMSMRQADEYLQTEGEQLKTDVGKAVNDGIAADAAQASADRVRDQLKGQLDTVNRFTPDVNEAYAGLTSAFYATTAAELGTTPEDMAASHPVTFQAQGVTDGSLTEEVRLIDDDQFPATQYELTGRRETINGIEYVGAKPRVRGDKEGKKEQLLPITGPDAVSALARAVKADGSLTEEVQQGSGPTASTLTAELNKSGEKALRGLVDSAGDLHVWDAAEATHHDKAAELGIPYSVGQEGGQDNRAWVRFEDGYPVMEFADGVKPPKVYLRSDKVLFDVPGHGLITGREYGDILQGDDELEQNSDASKARGAYNPGTNTITLLRGADLSTTLHELGHFFLETMARVSVGPDAPTRLKQDFATLTAFMGFGESTPPVRDGYTRFYHGGAPEGEGPLWVTRSKEDGEGWASRADGMQLWFVDVSDEDLALLDPDADLENGIVPLSRLELPAELASRRKVFKAEPISPEAWLALPLDQRRDGHETVARAFEAYLREGKAPSAALKAPFQRFKSWLVHVYKTVAQLRVNLTDEVRGVFDRLVATETEIAKAETARGYAPLVQTKPAGASEPEWEEYQRLGAQATADAQDALGSRSIRDMQWLRNTRSRLMRKFAAEAREKRKAVKAEITAEVLAEPVYAAQQYFRRGVLDGEQQEGVVHKLKTDEVAAIYEGTPVELQDWRKLGFGKFGMMAEEGLEPDQAAELFGFSSGHELVEALLNAAPMREEIEGRTDTVMMERYGDLKDPASIAQAADEAIHNEARLRFAATEHAMLAKATGSRKMLVEAARDFARDLIGRQRLRDLKPAKYTGAETRAAVASQRAAAKGDLVLAATEKRNQIINGYAAKAAYEAQDAVAVAMRYLKRFESTATRKGLDPDYRDQIDAMLERFDLRTGQTLRAIDKRKSLKSWMEAMDARGTPAVIDPALENEANRKHYKDLTVDELKGLVDAVKNIAHLGRLKNKLLTAARDRDFGRTRDAIVDRIQDSAYKTLPVRRESNTVMASASHNVRGYLAVHRTFPGMIQKMEGLAHQGGIMWRALVQNKNDAESNEAARRSKASRDLNGVFKGLVDQGGLTKKLFIKEIGDSLSLEGRIAVVLNMGNEINRERVMSGEKWSEAQLEAIAATLTVDQLVFVNAVHEYIDSYWPEIAAKSRRVSGVEPARVEAKPHVLTASDGSTVQMRGGYYPIKYNVERSNRSRADVEAADLMNTKLGLYVRAMTRQGHLKARSDSTGRPLRYDLGVVFQHVNEVIHDLAFHEYLIDANRLVGDTAVEAAIKAHYGPEYHEQLVTALQAMALGPQMSTDAASRALRYLRSATVKSKLAFNLVSVAKQTIGLSQTMVEIGPKYLMHGMGKVLGDAVQLKNTAAEVQNASTFMAERGRTFQREVNEVHNRVRSSVSGAAAEAVLGAKAGKAKQALSQLDAASFYLMQKMQFAVDLITWTGAHEKALAKGSSIVDAVGLADQAVINSQSSGLTGDLAAVTRDSEVLKLLTSFMGPMVAIYNQMDARVAETRRVGPARAPLLAAEIAMTVALPAVLTVAITKAFGGGSDDNWLTAITKAGIEQLLGFFVLIRDLAPALEEAVGLKSYAPRGPPALAILPDSYNLAKQLNQGEADAALRAAAVNVTGDLTGIPAVQINRSADGWEAMAKGDTQNPVALAFGAPKK